MRAAKHGPEVAANVQSVRSKEFQLLLRSLPEARGGE